MKKKKALIVVDMQKDFVTGCLGTKEAQAIVNELAEFIKTYDGDVYFTRDTHREDYLNTQEGKILPVIHCVENTDGWEIIPELKQLSEEKAVKIINKPTFGSIELAEALRDGGYDEVEFCGVCTGICVISNAMLAKTFNPELVVTIIEKLCACVNVDTHNTAIAAMQTLQMFVK